MVTIRRALWPPPEADARNAPTRGPGILDRLRWLEARTDHPIRILTTGLAGFLTAVALCVPFGLRVLDVSLSLSPVSVRLSSGLIDQVFKTAGGYPYASVNAYNPWALATVNGTGVAANSGWACDTLILNPPAGGVSCPEAVMVFGIPAVTVGAILLTLAFVVVCLVVAWRPTPVSLLTGLAILAIAFFFLPTRVHERYLFPFIAIGAILAAASIRWRIGYAILSATTFLNMYVVLTTLYPGNPGIRDWLGIGDEIRSPEGVLRISLAGVPVLIWAFLQLVPSEQRRLAREIEAGADLDEADDEAWDDEAAEWADDLEPATDGDVAASRDRDGRRWGPAGAGALPGPAGAAAAAGGAVAGVGALAMPRPVTMPTWSEPPSFTELGPIAWFRAKLAERPIRADRSRALHGEPSGRLDKLDLWILVVLIAAMLGIRMFRLSEPYEMHFDEVYHARTATEFLQDWRYGMSHDIYEYTHPHLAKYAMAGGLVAWGDDRVTGTSQLGVPVVDAAIEPRNDDPAFVGDRAGDRLDVVTGSELRSYDLATRELIATIPIPGATAVAVDDAGFRLVIGGRDGSISTVDVTALDTTRNAGSAALTPEPFAFAQVDGRDSPGLRAAGRGIGARAPRRRPARDVRWRDGGGPRDRPAPRRRRHRSGGDGARAGRHARCGRGSGGRSPGDDDDLRRGRGHVRGAPPQ